MENSGRATVRCGRRSPHPSPSSAPAPLDTVAFTIHPEGACRVPLAVRWRLLRKTPLPGPGPRPGRAVRGLPSWAAASPLSSPGKPRRQPPGSRRSESSCQARRPGRPAALGAWGSPAAPTSARQAPAFPAASVTSDGRPKSNQFSKAERRSPGPHVLCAGPLTNSSTVHPVYALSRRRQGGA